MVRWNECAHCELESGRGVGLGWLVGWLVVLVKKGSRRWGPVLSWRHFLSLWLFPNSYPFITRSILSYEKLFTFIWSFSYRRLLYVDINWNCYYNVYTVSFFCYCCIIIINSLFFTVGTWLE